jgi:hypothetical protein
LLLQPYILAGIGLYTFSPETYYHNTWIPLPDLHTEGQGFAEYPGRKAYNLTQINMPVGLGLQYEMSPVLRCHFEIMYRKLWTDYLDDVSTTYIHPALFQQYFPASRATLAAKIADRRLGAGSGDTGGKRGSNKNNDAYFTGMVKIGFIMGRQRR